MAIFLNINCRLLSSVIVCIQDFLLPLNSQCSWVNPWKPAVTPLDCLNIIRITEDIPVWKLVTIIWFGVASSCCFDWSFCFTHTKYLSVHYVLAVQNERDRISSRRNIPDSQELPPITILAQAESLSKQVRILLWSYFPVVMFVCELMGVETLIFSLPPDHCSGRNSRHIRAEVRQCWGSLWFYETTVTGFGGMGQIYSCLWRATTGWPGNRAVMHDC